MPNPNTESELLKELGLEELLPEGQEDLLLDLNDAVYESAMLRIIEEMDEPTRTAFASLMESDPDEEQIQSFFTAHVPNADQIITETIEELGNDILAATGESQD